MIPIALDPAQTDIAVIGAGPSALRRLTQLQALGADPLVFCEAPDAAMVAAARGRLQRRLPNRRDLRALQAVWVTGMEEGIAAAIAADARAEKTLVNVEDVLPYCDFHQPAIVQRGALVLTASTGGVSPAAARIARETLETAFPEDWADALAELAQARRRARAEGVAGPLITAEAQAILVRRGLLPPAPPAH